MVNQEAIVWTAMKDGLEGMTRRGRCAAAMDGDTFAEIETSKRFNFISDNRKQQRKKYRYRSLDRLGLGEAYRAIRMVLFVVMVMGG